MTEQKISREVLRDLQRFVAEYPPATGFVRGPVEPAPIFLRPSERVSIVFERAHDLQGAHFWRSEMLAEAGESSSELDSQAFAAALVKQLAPNLSIRNLTHLVDAFKAELDCALTSRSEALEVTHINETNSDEAVGESQ